MQENRSPTNLTQKIETRAHCAKERFCPKTMGFRISIWGRSDAEDEQVLTNKGKYGLKAMVHLAGLEPGALAQVADIAEANTISKKFLDHILTELRHAGIVYSKKGKGGGYALARPAHEIRVGAIVRTS